jgi:acyl-CoA synthetase (AMP-forming)/AMP-acid ligase II
LPEGSRVALLLPNGPELAVAVVAVVSRWCAAPINPTNTREEIKAELESTRAQAIIILAGASANEAALEAAKSLSIGIIVITPTAAISGLFRMALLQKVPQLASACGYTVAKTTEGFKAFDHPETVLLLHTSGTSGNKKLVPYSLDMIVTGVGCIIASWDLRPSDVCLNMMPLFHIGGIMRNVLSPILSGGCVITCSGFDPLLFWDILSAPATMPHTYPSSSPDGRSPPGTTTSTTVYSPLASSDNTSNGVYDGISGGTPILPTWYYAAPTMHHAILMEADRRPKPLPVQTVRYIANAAGGLLPVLANALKTTFGAVILTSYGMTEW